MKTCTSCRGSGIGAPLYGDCGGYDPKTSWSCPTCKGSGKMSETLEYCAICGNTTGRSGRGEDSLYIQLNALNIKAESGPYCESCYEDAISVWNDGILKRGN